MVDKIDKERLASQYGFAMAFMRSNDELWRLFNQAVKQTWTPDRFIAKLRDTDWFKKHSANVRNAIMQETSDPATYQANVDQMYAEVKNAWGAMFGTQNVHDRELRQWAETAHRMGWSQAQLIDRMTQGLDFKKMLKSKTLGGAAADVEGQLNALISDYGIDLGQQWKAAQVAKLMKGNDTIEGVRQRIREMAARQYKAFADAIQSGQTIRDVAEPYVQQMASLLEINPADVDLKNKLIQQALKQRDKKGNPAAMDLNDFADLVRSDERWQYTDNAREQVSGVVAELARAFGTLA